MAEEELIKRLNSTADYLRRRSEDNLRDLGIPVSAERGSQLQKKCPTMELEALLVRHDQDLTTGIDLRRIAELVELLESKEKALAWWRRAVERGDLVSILMMEDEAEREK